MEIEFFTVNEFAKYLRVHPITIRRAIRQGKIRAFRLNPGIKSSWRIHKSEVERMAELDFNEVVDKIIENRKESQN